MNIHTIAEFVENQQILDALSAIGVDYAQGYHIDKPTPPKLRRPSRSCRRRLAVRLVGIVIFAYLISRLDTAAYVGPGANIREELSMGVFATAGIGAVVIRDVQAGETVAGNPACPIIDPELGDVE